MSTSRIRPTRPHGQVWHGMPGGCTPTMVATAPHCRGRRARGTATMEQARWQGQTAATSFLADAWSALGGAPLPEDAVRVSGRTGLTGPLRVPALVVGAVAAQLLAARELRGQPEPLHLDARHVGFAV